MENTKNNTLLPRFNPWKDIPLLSVLLIIIVSIIITTYLLIPKGTDKYVNIKYDSHLLYDKETKQSEFTFPTSGSKEITLYDKDGKDYGYDNDFSFINGRITLTLYSDKSIQIKKEDVSCLDHTCSKLGRIYSSYTPLVCLPNHFMAMIVENGYPEFDA